jgi:hypothetical protein
MDLFYLARPERFELPTAWFVARYSIQLSYGRIVYSLGGSPSRAAHTTDPDPSGKAVFAAFGGTKKLGSVSIYCPATASVL